MSQMQVFGFINEADGGSLTQSFLVTARLCGKVMFSYCLRVCVSVTFECLNIETSFLVWWYILTISRSGFSTKVIGPRSRSLLKIDYFDKILLL